MAYYYEPVGKFEISDLWNAPIKGVKAVGSGIKTGAKATWGGIKTAAGFVKSLPCTTAGQTAAALAGGQNAVMTLQSMCGQRGVTLPQYQGPYPMPQQQPTNYTPFLLMGGGLLAVMMLTRRK